MIGLERAIVDHREAEPIRRIVGVDPDKASAAAYGSGLTSTARTTLTMAVVAPRPTPTVRIIVAASAGVRARLRRQYRTSRIRWDMMTVFSRKSLLRQSQSSVKKTQSAIRVDSLSR